MRIQSPGFLQYAVIIQYHQGWYKLIKNILQKYLHIFHSSFFCLNYANYLVTKLQHVFLGLLSVRQQSLQQSVSKAVSRGWKVHFHSLPIPVEGVHSNRTITERAHLILYNLTRVLYYKKNMYVQEFQCSVAVGG